MITASGLALLLLGTQPAEAADTVVTVDGTTVRGSAHLAVSGERLLAALRDPSWESAVAGEATRAAVVGVEGDCQRVAYVSQTAVIETTYTLRRCPTADGWESTLLASNAFDAYHARWTVEPDEGGCRARYAVELSTSLWVPDGLVRSETRRAVERRLQAMVAWSRLTSPSLPP